MIHGRGATRAFWLGLTLFGGVYLAISMVPSIESRLPTTKVLTYLDSKRPEETRHWFNLQAPGWDAGNSGFQKIAFAPNGQRLATAAQGGVRIWDVGDRKGPGDLERHHRELHPDRALLLALFFGWCGGLLSRAIHDRSRSTERIESRPRIDPAPSTKEAQSNQDIPMT